MALLLAGCGRAASPDGVASLKGANPTASSTNSAAASPEDQMLQFARCMRQHGVNMPDPKVVADGHGGTQGKVTINGGAGDKSKLDAAQKACQKYLPKGGTLNPNDPQALDRALKLARCLRAHGVNVADPKPSQPGILIQGKKGDDPKVRKAMEACAPAKGDGPGVTTSGGGDTGGAQTSVGGQ